jgi:acetoin:2,6-dichlorophenolindophenol oxidoreductase subunit alpha
MKYPIVMPRLGATGDDVRIVEWLVAEGAPVKAGQALFVVETDKATSEVEAFRDGYLAQVIKGAGAECAPGEAVGELTDERAEAASTPGPPSEPPATAARRPVRVRLKLASGAPQERPAEPTPRRAPADDPAPAADRLIEAFRLMALIRRYEEHLYQLFLQGLVPGTLHQCQGQEAVAVGVCTALRRDDVIYSTHRPVGHLIAKGASLNAITAEIWGKATGCAGGKGGQMHLADFSVGAMVSNAIVGANIPIATGSAMGFRLQGLDRIAVSFFGDGASNIGAFHEGLNLAAVQRAPVVFVCENNLYGASTHVSTSMLIADIASRAAAYGMPGVSIDGMDVEAVHGAAAQAVERARRGGGPTLIECKTYRYRGHSRGDPGNYRGAEEHRQWTARDPIERMRGRLTGDFGMTGESLQAIEREHQQRVEAAVAFALASADPTPASALEHVLAP